MPTKRLRIFAGPNGSGKSSIHKILIENGDINLGIFVNADEIEKQLKNSLILDFSNFGINLNIENLCNAYKDSKFYILSNGKNIINNIHADKNKLTITSKEYINSYFTAFIAEYIRVEMLDIVNVITIETVMSHKSKIEYIKLAKSKGYRVYLYFVATDNVQINIARVQQRVENGGHTVSEDKITSRYQRCLENLFEALTVSDRAYIFDNSELYKPIWCAEYDGKNVYLKHSEYPQWIKTYLLNKIN
ncbi:MAG: zeta toxin family protein [bacterium]